MQNARGGGWGKVVLGSQKVVIWKSPFYHLTFALQCSLDFETPPPLPAEKSGLDKEGWCPDTDF